MPRVSTPRYRLHKQSGQAIVTLPDRLGQRRDVPLGPYNSPASHAEYDRVIAEWLVRGRQHLLPPTNPAERSVNDVILAFLQYAQTHYSTEGRETQQFRLSLGPLRQLYGSTPATRFGPKELKAVRLRMVHDGLCRNVINRRITRIKTLWKWAAEEALVPGSVYQDVRAVRSLPPNAPGVRQTAHAASAFGEHVERVAPFCPRPVAAMLRLQYLAGMRSGEVRILRTVDVDTSNPACWLYRPGSDAGPFGKHKNAWRGQERVVAFGPQAIAILRPWLRPTEPMAFLFDPRQSVQERNDARRKAGRVSRRVTKPKRSAGACYTAHSYPQAVRRACEAAGVSFRPYDLRHGRKMEVRRQLGDEAARSLLGQKSIQSTQHYGTLDLQQATDVASQLG